MARRTITRPRQAASARTLDRWQNVVKAAIREKETGYPAVTLHRLRRLLKSMERAERR
jgi:hypothetical protein